MFAEDRFTFVSVVVTFNMEGLEGVIQTVTHEWLVVIVFFSLLLLPVFFVVEELWLPKVMPQV